MTLPANIRVNVRATFPTQVRGAGFIGVTKASGIWTINPDYRTLAASPNLSSNQVLALQNATTGVWSYINAVQFLAAASNAYRIITTAGAQPVLSTDVVLLFNPNPAGVSTVQLPTALSRNGVSVTVKDIAGNANANVITIVPSGAETIDGLSGAAAAANGIALVDRDYGSRTLYPLLSGGWYSL